ncbi:MAG: response regulator receiver protein [Maricaulis sp.]|uniref:response regulator receiver protein n=1 Tax=Maricaulis sp. TaxID=1486257 RepID=UPI0026033B84|nr:response regulator receiver protein [Maricaulis sp.]MDM7982864.1 response regulator receiver protein [Maricaulis sp.]
MAETDYARAPVLLFDPVHANQRTTRYALFEIGFRQIECVSTLEDLKAGITDGSPLMIVAESSATDADVFRIVRSIRRSELGNNPFVVILLTTWSRDTAHIRKAIECGADDLIVRPFSTMFAEERVRTLIKGRKQFIVTSDYIGPDRRKNNDRNSSAQTLEVPNLLQAVVEGDTEALSRGSQWIQEAKSAVSAERIRRVAMRIVVGVELYMGGTKDGSYAKLDIDDMAKTSRELRAQLIKASRAEAAEVAQALIDQIGSLKPDEAPAASLKLIKELAMGAYAAFANGDGLEKSRDEIDRTVASLRKRLQARAAAVQAQQAAQAADGAGQSEQAALKRAAM